LTNDQLLTDYSFYPPGFGFENIWRQLSYHVRSGYGK